MELRFLYKLKCNTLYIETLNTLDDRENQNYEENKKPIKPMGVYLRRLEERDRRDELDTATPMVGKQHNILHFLQHKWNHSISHKKL